MKLRKQARNRPCQIRLPGCDGGGETTVLAHYNLAGLSGMGMKSPDIAGAWACHHCHDIIDGRRSLGEASRDYIRLAHAEGALRTIVQLLQEGRIRIV